MTKAIFDNTKLDNKSISRVRYATSEEYRSSVKKIELQRINRLNIIQTNNKVAMINKIKSL